MQIGVRRNAMNRYKQKYDCAIIYRWKILKKLYFWFIIQNVQKLNYM